MSKLYQKGQFFSLKRSLNLKGNLINLEEPIVMGILNVTPDSFYDGGRYHQNDSIILSRAEQILREGATIIDIGGYSSRPGAEHISADEEKKRAIKAVELVSKSFPEAYISIDTFRSDVAREAVTAGASVVNDISGGNLDEYMFDTVASLQVPYILMHMRGTPQDMKELTNYEDLTGEIIDYFQKKLVQLREKGVADVIIDPGFGFAKTIDQNYELLRKLRDFEILDVPLLAGLSRKSMIYKRLGLSADEALNGTTVLNTVAIMNGASILRVHDVKEAIQTIKILKYTYS
ncbi:dihydropteroate synthase [Porifericola rhodea]|uniref:dihydropteroate synthase n=1 Tax=Porifericola rhodea TaxID=930972 RepID=UPI002666C7A3|nr:dihydropteroate synthase [Porifericola rhodea]WKN32370.1 dihydropteroate synthase [Porifericola rhodea]